MDPNYNLNMSAEVAVSLLHKETNKFHPSRKLVFKFRRDNDQESRVVLGHIQNHPWAPPNNRKRLLPLETTPSSPSSGLEEEEDHTSVLQPFKKRKTFREHTLDDLTLPPTTSSKEKKKKITPPPPPRSGDFLRPEPDHLPSTLQNWIRENGGEDLKFIHQKHLKSSDVSKNNNRLSVPVRRVQSPEFLSEEEKEKVKERDLKGRIKGMQVKVVDQNLREYQLCLKQWDMAGTSVYNLITRWNQVVRDNNLKENSNLQLWSFRLQSQLCFALVKVQEVINIVEPTQEVIDHHHHHHHEVVEERNMTVDLELRLWPLVT